MSDYEKIAEHIGHNIVVVEYGDGENVAVECEDCHTVLVDFDRPENEEDEEEDEPQISASTLKQELENIESALATTAGHLEGLANDGFGWTKPDAENERQRFRAALRENAETLRKLAARVSVE